MRQSPAMNTKNFLTILTLCLTLNSGISAREWTEKATGKKIQAKYVSSDGETVTILFNRQQIPMPISRFSEADQAFVAERIAEQKQAAKQLEQSALYTDFITGEFTHCDKPIVKNGLPFWLFGDKKMTSDTKKYPLVVVLHGRRNNAKPDEQFRVQSIATPWAKKENQSKNPCFVIQPYYPPQSGWEKLPEKLDATVEHLIESLPIDTKRIYIMGFSNGGQGTFQALARHPDYYAGAITVSGPVGINSVVGKIKTPIRSWVGENDHDLNKRKRVEALAKALKEDGVDIECVVVKGAGHSCHHIPLKDPSVHDWLFSKTLK